MGISKWILVKKNDYRNMFGIDLSMAFETAVILRRQVINTYLLIKISIQSKIIIKEKLNELRITKNWSRSIWWSLQGREKEKRHSLLALAGLNICRRGCETHLHGVDGFEDHCLGGFLFLSLQCPFEKYQ